jgi:hypothetical protein
MSPVAFFRIALLLPLTAPLAALIFDANWITGVLLISLAFGGAQYVLFALVLFVWIGRVRNARRIRHVSLIAPPPFL